MDLSKNMDQLSARVMVVREDGVWRVAQNFKKNGKSKEEISIQWSEIQYDPNQTDHP